MSSRRKSEYVVTYDYGMGDLWLLIFAASEDEILRKYPFLKIQKTALSNLGETEKEEMRKKFLFDIDDEPRGLLLDILKENI